MYKKYVQLRDAKGVTDYEVAKQTGIPQSTFSDWKKERSSPKLEKLLLLSKYFDVTIDYFIED